MKKILAILGTRPEAVKLAPIILKLKDQDSMQMRVCVTAQHRKMLDQTLDLFSIKPDSDLNLMQPGQTLAELTSRVILMVDRVLELEQPDIVMLQGDTTTVMTAALAAFYQHIRVAHVEAGLRSGNLDSPFPEEMNRRVVGLISGIHFAPTETAVKALLREGVPNENIYLTGNPVIDALHMILQWPVPSLARELLERAGVHDRNGRRLLLVTAHRRENFGERLESICRGLKAIVERNKDVTIIYPVHLNPNVQEPVHRILGNVERIFLTEPLEYDVLAHLMKASYLVLTDSGGIQEEAPSLGKPVLVMRTETERPEGITAGTARLVGPDEKKILEDTEELLNNYALYNEMARAVNPYGDGHSAERIVQTLSLLK